MGIDYTSLAVSILLQVVQNASERNKYRRALLKVFKAIANGFESDQEFRATALSIYAKPKGGGL